MTKNLTDLLNLLRVLSMSNTKYYKLNDLHSVLEEMHGQRILVDDIILTPYYICEYGVLELYDYELNIRLVELPSEKQFLLAKTGVERIEEINVDIERKLRNCYLEVVIPSKSLLANELSQYIDHIKSSIEIKKRISENLHEFNLDKLYFEIF